VIDWLGIPEGTRAKYIGLIHGISNVVVVILFIASWFVRGSNPAAPGMTGHSPGVDQHRHSAFYQSVRRWTGLSPECRRRSRCESRRAEFAIWSIGDRRTWPPFYAWRNPRPV